MATKLARRKKLINVFKGVSIWDVRGHCPEGKMAMIGNINCRLSSKCSELDDDFIVCAGGTVV